MNNYWYTIVTTLLVLLLSAPSLASGDKTPVRSPENKDDVLGWHFYWPDPEPELEPEDIDPNSLPMQVSEAPPPQHKPFSSKWFKQNFPIIQQRAIDNPNKQNMLALLYAEHVMADKSETFGRKKVYYASLDPNLQPGSRLPFTGAAVTANTAFKREQKQQALDQLSDRIGLVLFYDGQCRYCSAMVPIINKLHRDHKFDITVLVRNHPYSYIERLDPNIKVMKDVGQSETFNIKVWPAVAMLRPPQDVMVLSQGTMYFSALRDQMLNVAFEMNILDKDWFYRVNPEQQGLVSPMQLANVPQEIVNDPVLLINYMANLIANPDGAYAPEGNQLEENDETL